MSWIRLIRGSPSKHGRRWRPSKAKSGPGGDVHSTKTHCHRIFQLSPRRTSGAMRTSQPGQSHQHEDTTGRTRSQSPGQGPGLSKTFTSGELANKVTHGNALTEEDGLKPTGVMCPASALPTLLARPRLLRPWHECSEPHSQLSLVSDLKP